MVSFYGVLVAILPFSELLHFSGTSPSDAVGSVDTQRHGWGFSNYFDDLYNFKEFPELNSLHPLTIRHWSAVLFHRGVNVLEPLANVMKAAVIDGVGLDPYLLRIVTLGTHFLNAFLLAVWLVLLTEQRRLQLGYARRTSWTIIAALCALWTVHPLHAEVIGWLSAQNYAFALTFALLSSIHLELALQAASPVSKKDKDKGKGKGKGEDTDAMSVVLPRFFQRGIRAEGHLAATVLLYVCACACKAPAIVLPGCHVLRILGRLISAPSGTSPSSSTACGATKPAPDLSHKSTKMLDKLYPEKLVIGATAAPCSDSAGTGTHTDTDTGTNARLRSLGFTYLFYASLACAVCAHGIFGANIDSVTQVPEFTSSWGFCIGAALRCGIVLKSHMSRALLPVRLMAIYAPPQALSHLYFLPDLFSSRTGGPVSAFSDPAALAVAEDALAGVLSVAAVSVLVFVGCVWRGDSILALGWLTYLLLWLPGLGLVQHGLDVLGADRYNYFPLALGAAPMAWSVLCSVVGGYSNASSKQGANVGQQHRITAVLVLLAVPVFFFYAAKQNAQLFLWRNDGSLLQANLHADPSCDMCHVWLSEHYGFHLHDETNGVLHREKFLNLTLAHVRKGQWTYLPAAGTLIQLNKKKEACELVDRAYALGRSAGGPVKQAHTNHAMATNDYIICRCMKGMSKELAQQSVTALADILQADELAAGAHLRPMIRTKLAAHVAKLQQWQRDGTAYEASFLW